MTLRELFFSLGYKEDKGSKQKVENGIKNLKGMATKMLGAIGVAFSISGLATVSNACLEAASAAEEMQNKFDVVFGECSKGAEDWASNYSDAIGRSRSVIKTYMADNQNLLTGFGMTRDAATDMTEKMITAALDLASFNNMQDDEAVNAFSKAMMGESESAKRLGAVLNDSTRELAMQELGLSGNYNKLSQLEKMQVNYQAIMDQSKDSIGDCVRSADSYESSVRRQNAAMQDMKELLGQFIMPAMAELRNGVTAVIKGFTGWLRKMKDSNDAGNKLVLMIRRAKEMIARFADFVVRGAKAVNSIVQKIGGWERVLRVLAIAAGIVLAAFQVNKIVKGIKSISTVLNPMTLKILAIVAVVLILAAIIDDFINFMQGNDSVIGELMKKAGIDTDAAREKILTAWNAIKEGLGAAWEYLKQVATVIFDALKQFWEQWGDRITDIFMTMFTHIMEFFGGFLDFITGIFSGNWEQAWEGLKTMFVSWISAIKDFWTGLGSFLLDFAANLFGPIFEKIKSGWDSIVAWFTSLPDMAKQWMHDFVTGLINGIKEKIEGFVDTIKGIGDKIRSFLHFSVPDEGPLTDYESWMPDFIGGLAKGIRDNIPLIEDAVGKASETLNKMGNVSVHGKTALNAAGNTSKTNNVQQNNEYNITVTGTDKQAVNNAANTLSSTGNDNTGALARALCYG